MRAIPIAFLRYTLVLGAVGALTACSSLPRYSVPEAAVPDRYAAPASPAQPASGWALATPGDAQPRGDWWTLFNDSELNRLEEQLAVSNQSIKKAVAQLQQARAMIDYQRAGFMPTVSAGAAQSRNRLSQNVEGHALAGQTVPDYSMGLSASWEPDLFGRVSDAVVNARDTAQASDADLEAVRLSMRTDLASDYFALRALDIQKKLLDDSVSAYAAALNILKQQLACGAVDASATAQAETQLESTRSQATDIDIQRAQITHAIATLIGVPASSFSLPPKIESIPVPLIPAGVPSQLLQRRPDIAAAERRVAAANAQIGEARAAYYPDLTLSATAGLESTFFAPWLTAPSLFWSIGPQIVGTLFDGGKRRAALNGATARYDGSVADYRQTVLAAFQQVEDKLSALQSLASEAQSQRLATAAAERALRLTQNRYQAGAVSYLDVVTEQTIALSNQRTEAQIQARRVDACVQLLKALGGGWDRTTLASSQEND